MSPSDLSKSLEQLLKSKKSVSLEKTCQIIANITTHLIFLQDNQLDLHRYGLIPMMAFSTAQQINQPIQVSIPLLSGKIVQWSVNLAGGSEPVSRFLLKLGTGNRVNHCRLVLSILARQPEKLASVATAHFDGTLAQDNQWADLVLDQPLLPGQYICQLVSPDADNNNNTLFLWLTTEKTFLPDNLIDLYDYGLMPIMSLSSTPKINPTILTQLPLLAGKSLQWQMDLVRGSKPITAIFLKLGTGDRINPCQLILSVFMQRADQLSLAAVARREGTTILDGQWSKFTLDHPLLPGQYICQLQSPDAQSDTSTLFIWLTTEGMANYCYASPSPISLKTELNQLKQFPLISVIVPLLARERIAIEIYLVDCLNSVFQQIYPHWELCIVTDTTDTVLEKYCQPFLDRIKLIYTQSDPSIANLYNKALESVTGEYSIFLYPSDLLGENALLAVAKSINQAVAPIDMCYSDEDRVNENNFFDKPYFKPAWSAELLKGQMYTGQLSVYRTHLLKKIGGFQEALSFQSLWDWAADQLKGLIDSGQLGNLLKKIGSFYQEWHRQHLWELALRLSEHTHRIQHIPQILYHQRRLSPILINQTIFQQMVQDVLDREERGGQIIINPLIPNVNLIGYPVQKQPLVSIIIPTKDMAPLLARCIDSICAITTYPHWEIIVIDNASTEAATLALFEKYQANLGNRFTVSCYNDAFNFSKLVNQGVKIAQGEIILLLNNDTEILEPPDWLQHMIGFAQHPEIAGVGAKLLYPADETIQHAGLICGVAGVANHGHKHFPVNSSGYFNRLTLVTNYSAITGACLMVKRVLWETVNGFDDNLAIAFNDVDFCLKLLQNGLRHVVLPSVIFYHHESKSRGLENTFAKKRRLSQEEAYMKRRWESFLKNDPFYNPHLTRHLEDFSLDPDSIYYCETSKKSLGRLAWFKWLKNRFN